MNGNPVTSPNPSTPALRLAALGLSLPDPAAAVGAYAGFVLDGGLLVISGQLARRADGSLITGRLGAGLSIEEGQEAARACALNLLAQAMLALGDLSRIRRTVRLSGYVQATADFTDHPKVVNGASDLIAAVLGEAGVHTRVALGAVSLPLGSATEVDAWFAVAP